MGVGSRGQQHPADMGQFSNPGKTDNVLQFMTHDFEKNLIEFHQHDKKSKLKF